MLAGLIHSCEKVTGFQTQKFFYESERENQVILAHSQKFYRKNRHDSPRHGQSALSQITPASRAAWRAQVLQES